MGNGRFCIMERGFLRRPVVAGRTRPQERSQGIMQGGVVRVQGHGLPEIGQGSLVFPGFKQTLGHTLDSFQLLGETGEDFLVMGQG